MPPKKSGKRKGPKSSEKTPTEGSETIDPAAEKEPAEEQREGSGKMFQHVCFSFWQDARDAPEAFGLHVVFIHVIYFLTESPARASKTGDASQASQATSSPASAPPSSQVETPAEEASQGASQGAKGRLNNYIILFHYLIQQERKSNEILDEARST